MKLLLAALIATSTAGAARAQTPPAGWLADVSPSAAADPRLPGAFSLGSATITLERTTLAEAAAAAPGHVGEAGNSLYWLCFTLPDSRLWLLSDGEMGGPEHRITGAVLVAEAKPTASADCPAAPLGMAPVLIPGAGLGATAAALTAALGPAASRGEARIAFAGQSPAAVKGTACVTTRWAGADLRGGKAQTIALRQITAC